MRQKAKPSKKIRRRHCKCCRDLFEPDRRPLGGQRYCCKPECQTVRQRANEKDWARRNPEPIAIQKRKWQQKRPGYSGQRRADNPELAEQNRQDTRQRMQKLRFEAMFDKSKPILTQLTGKNRDKCCLMRGRWLFLRLTRASRWTKGALIRHTGGEIKRIANHLPKSKVYDLTGILKGKGHDG
jgi:hypothetical protein